FGIPLVLVDTFPELSTEFLHLGLLLLLPLQKITDLPLVLKGKGLVLLLILIDLVQGLLLFPIFLQGTVQFGKGGILEQQLLVPQLFIIQKVKVKPLALSNFTPMEGVVVHGLEIECIVLSRLKLKPGWKTVIKAMAVGPGPLQTDAMYGI